MNQEKSYSVTKGANTFLMSINENLFDYLHGIAQKEIDPSDLHNHTGYFDNAVYAEIETNKLYKFTDKFGRRGLLFKPSFGETSYKDWEGNILNTVIFERYSNESMLVIQNNPGIDIPRIYKHLEEWVSKQKSIV